MEPIDRSRYSQLSMEDQISTVAVYDYSDKNLQGIFSNNLYGKDIVFNNLVSLLLTLEDCMNTNAFPQPMYRVRKMDAEDDLNMNRKSYRDGAEVDLPELEPQEEWKTASPIATFKVHIVFRTMSGWQGDVHCVETDERIMFKSDMELILFMDKEIDRIMNPKAKSDDKPKK